MTPTPAEATHPTVKVLAPVAAWKPLAVAVLGTAAFVCMDATVKHLGVRYGAVQLTFLRFAAGAVFALLLWAWFRTPLPARPSWRLHGLRVALLLVTLVCYFQALKVLPLAQAVAISYMAPIFISLLAMLVLHERPSRWIWLALAFGLAGTLVALWPELQKGHTPQLVGVAAASVAAVCFAGVMVLARVQAQRDALWSILVVQNVLPVLVLAAPVAAFWAPVETGDLPAIALTGLLATVGLWCVTWAFQHIEASTVAPLEYTGLIWAALLGYGVFGEVPTITTLASAVLIVVGCLVLLRKA
jgi:S-adenosylmethionine uptake transporter